jgi:hypothetical protein
LDPVVGWIRLDEVKVTRRCGRLEVEGAMWPVGVVVLDVDMEDVLELPAAYDQQPVETVAADRANPALREGVRVRRLERRADDLNTLAPEDVINGDTPASRRIFATVVAATRSPRPPSSPTILW